MRKSREPVSRRKVYCAGTPNVNGSAVWNVLRVDPSGV